MNKNPYCDVYLIRHGETDWNAQGKMQGHKDIALNIVGEKQALQLKEKLADVAFSAAYTSDLLRAKKTASLVVGAKEIEVVETMALREKSMGSWEGCSVADYLEIVAQKNLTSSHLTKEEYLSSRVHHDIESYAEVYYRLHNFLHSRIEDHVGATILLSSHGGVLASVLYHVDYRPGFRWVVSNCGYLKLRFAADGQLSLLETEGLTLKGAVEFCDAKSTPEIK